MLLKKHWIIEIFISIGILIIGIILGRTINHWSILKIKTEVDIINGITSIVSISVTAWVAYWVTIILTKENESNRKEKDLFLRKIETLSSSIETLCLKVSSQDILIIEITSSLKNIYRHYHVILHSASTSNTKLPITYLSDMDVCYFELRQLLTFTNIKNEIKENNFNLIIKDNKVEIDYSLGLEIELGFERMRTLIFKIELAINKS